MSKRNRGRRTENGAEEALGGAAAVNWLPIVLAIAALGLGFFAWTDARQYKAEATKRMIDIDTRIAALQTQVANAAKAKPPQQGPDPDKVYTVKMDGAPSHGNPTAPIVIAEFSDYQ